MRVEESDQLYFKLHFPHCLICVRILLSSTTECSFLEFYNQALLSVVFFSFIFYYASVCALVRVYVVVVVSSSIPPISFETWSFHGLLTN